MAAKTATQLKAELKANGYRLPHGYDIVKRKPRTVKKKASATSKKTVKTKSKKPLTVAQRKFASNAKRAGQLVKSGKAKDTKQAWKQIKMEF
jgi:hypothetical protein